MSALLLAAGQGTRMRSAQAKVLHHLGGRPVVAHVVEAARSVPCRSLVAVIGFQAADVRAAVEQADAACRPRGARAAAFALQERQLGTAHAVLAAERALRAERGTLLILNGDVPLVRPDTLRALLDRHRARGAALTVLTTVLDDPTGYGRIIRDGDGSIAAIREQADIAGDQEALATTEVNAGLYAAELDGLFSALRKTSSRNAQGEYYLPDLVGVLRDAGRRVERMLHPAPEEVSGINTRADLARASREVHRRKAEELMASGVTILDPASTYIDAGVEVGPDTVLHPTVRLEGRTRIGRGCVVHQGTRVAASTLADGTVVLDHCLIVESVVGPGARIGPFAHLRPGTRLGTGVHIGNFVETKKAVVGDRSKANHLAYLGDAEIGRDVNVGAGTITCNYDGWDKHRTVLEDGVFIGSDTQLVAPVKVGKGAFVGAGSTITKEVPAGALAISRQRQQNLDGWADRKRREMAQRKSKPARGRR